MWETIGFRHEDDLSSAVPLRMWFGTSLSGTHGIEPLDGTITLPYDVNGHIGCESHQAHTLTAGELVHIVNARPATLNRVWQVSNPTSTTFELAASEEFWPYNETSSLMGGAIKYARLRDVLIEGDSEPTANRSWPVYIGATNLITILEDGLPYAGASPPANDGTWRMIPPGTDRVLLQALDQDIHLTTDGSEPTSAAGGGLVLQAGQDPIAYVGPWEGLKFIEGTSAGGKINITFQRAM